MNEIGQLFHFEIGSFKGKNSRFFEYLNLLIETINGYFPI